MRFRSLLLAFAGCVLASAVPPARAVTLSLAVPSTTGSGTTPNAIVNIPLLSSDGRYLVFGSNATDLKAGLTDNNSTSADLFQRDLQTGEITLITHREDSATAGMNSRYTGAPRMSDDGAYVFFSSDSTTLVGGTGGSQHAYLWSRATNTVIRVAAVQTQGTGMSGDGKWLALYTAGPMPKNIYDGGQGAFPQTPGNYNLYLVGRETGAVILATHAVGDPATPQTPFSAQNTIAMSHDGRYCAFEGELVPAWDAYTGTFAANSEAVYLYDRVTDAMRIVTKRNDDSAPTIQILNPTVQGISPDGRYVYFHHGDIDFGSPSADTNGTLDLYRYDRDGSGATRLQRYFQDVVGIAPNNLTSAMDISANGRFLAFLSQATNLVPGDTNGRSDIFLFDTSDYAMRRMNLSGEAQWDAANGSFAVASPQVDDEGKVAFASNATGLGFTDGNGVHDTFLSVATFADTTAPTVASVNSSTADGTKGAGAAISIQVAFSERVNVTGAPRLALNSGGMAAYASGTGSSTLTFTYTVAVGDTAADLDYTAAGALTLNGGTIRDAAGNNATLTLPSPGAAGSLGANKALVVDTTAPAVISVVRLGGAAQATTATSVAFRVTYSEPVSGVSATCFALAPASGSSVTGSIASVTGSGATRDVTVTVTGGAGEFTLKVID